jgi:hypothetical protein
VLPRIAAERLQRHRLVRPAPADAAGLVAWFGAVQAQDFGAAKWALALRMRGALTTTDIERAFDDGRILRTHLMRPTWHFVTPADIHWLLELTAPRVHRALSVGRRHLELTDDIHRRATTLMARALERETHLTRFELGERLAAAGLPLKGLRMAFVTMFAELEGVVCSGPRRGKQFTYALLERQVRRPQRWSRDQALGELTARYFRSHGPATVRDFVWWSGLTVTDARRGLEIAHGRSTTIDGLTYWTVGPRRSVEDPRDDVYLLPIFDEYLVAYRDLVAVPREKAFYGLLPQAVVCGGAVVGTWKVVTQRGQRKIDLALGRKLTGGARDHLDRAIDRYTRFAGFDRDRQ